MDDTNDLCPPFEAEGVIPLGDTEEEKDVFQRLQRLGSNDCGEQLLSKVADCGRPLRDLEQRTEAALASLLAIATATAVAVSTSRETYRAFVGHPYWRGKRPGTNKLLLRVLQLHLQPTNTNQHKMLSRYASAITWLVLQGFDPDTLVDGLAQEGGVAACATKHAAWRRARRTKVIASGKAVEQRNAPEAMDGKPADASVIKASQTEERAPEPTSTTAASTPTTPAAATSNEDKPHPEAVRINILPEIHEQIKHGAPPMSQQTFYGRFTPVGDVITLVQLYPFMILPASGRLSDRRPLRYIMPKRPGSASGAS